MSAGTFQYEAVDRRGLRRCGVARAATPADAYRQIVAAGLTPVVIRPVRRLTMWRRRRVGLAEIANFTYQFSVLMAARVPIGEGIRSIAEQEPPGRFRDVLYEVAGRIESGQRIADALAGHADVFGDLYVQTVRAGEESGNLVRVLEYLADMLERQIEARQQVRSALMYPACVVAALVLAVVFLVAFTLPRFARMFAARGVDLPLFTRALLVVGESFQAYWWAWAGGMAAVAWGLRTLWRTRRGRWHIERLLHAVPVLREVLVGTAVARFARVLGVCLNAGIGLIDAVHMAGQAASRPMLRRDADRIIEQVRAGGRLAAVLTVCTYLPPFARRLLAAGDESGELGRMCQVVARRYDRDAASLARNLITVIEPVLIVLIAAVVLMVALAVFVPMWDMVKVVG